MKKLFSAFMAATVALSAMATETAYVRMKIAGSNPTYSTSTIKLTEDSERTPAYESGYDSERMMEQSNDNSVLFYAFVGTQECANIATNNLDGLVLCFNTNNIDQNYTISFELVSGRDLTLYDRVTKTSTSIVQGQSYPFSVEAAQVGRVAIKDRFVINYEAPAYVIMKGDFNNPGNTWAYTSNFTDNGTSFSLNLNLAANTWYHFQLEEGYASAYVAANGAEFDRDHASHYIPVDGWHEQLTLHTDVAGTYTFTWYDLTDNLTISFPDVVEVTTNEDGWASFSYNMDLSKPAGLTIYYGQFDNVETLTLVEADHVKADQGVIVKGEPATTYYFTPGTGSAAYTENALQPSTAWATRGTAAIYCLRNVGGVTALYQYTGSEFPDNKAYLPVNVGGANPAPKHVRLKFEGAQGIETISQEPALNGRKLMIDGQMYIKRGDVLYTLQGQMVK